MKRMTHRQCLDGSLHLAVAAAIATGATIASTRIRGLGGLDDSSYRGDLTRCMDDLWLTEEDA